MAAHRATLGRAALVHPGTPRRLPRHRTGIRASTRAAAQAHGSHRTQAAARATVMPARATAMAARASIITPEARRTATALTRRAMATASGAAKLRRRGRATRQPAISTTGGPRGRRARPAAEQGHRGESRELQPHPEPCVVASARAAPDRFSTIPRWPDQHQGPSLPIITADTAMDQLGILVLARPA